MTTLVLNLVTGYLSPLRRDTHYRRGKTVGRRVPGHRVWYPTRVVVRSGGFPKSLPHLHDLMCVPPSPLVFRTPNFYSNLGSVGKFGLVTRPHLKYYYSRVRVLV